jgi:5'-3' exonuclease
LRQETLIEGLDVPCDLERVIDDVVLLAILVGNDFLPHSPTLDINEGAMDVLFEVYRSMRPSTTGYLTNGDAINMAILEQFLAEVASRELDTLTQRAEVPCPGMCCCLRIVLPSVILRNLRES